MERYDRVLGAILGAAIADALAVPFRTRPYYLNKIESEKLLNFVFPNDCPKEIIPGKFSDVFSIAMVNLEAYIEKGTIDEESTIKSLHKWDEDEKYKYYHQFIGPTTKVGISRLNGTFDPKEWKNDILLRLPCDQFGITSGASSKAWVPGIFAKGDYQKAITYAKLQSKVTHDNTLALSGAGAIAAAMNLAMQGNSIKEIIEEGIKGSIDVYNESVEYAKDAAGASIEKRTIVALKIVDKYKDNVDDIIINMADIVGTGNFASETVASAFGFIYAFDADIMKCIFAAIKAGNNTCAIASICGALCGAIKGYKSIPNYQKYLRYLSEANGIDIERLAIETAK